MTKNLINPLLVYSNHGFGSYSSYSNISKYISNCEVISNQRSEPNNLSGKIINRLFRAFSTSQWYRISSLELEWLLLRKIHSKSLDLVHFLWAERDLGYFPLFNSYKSTPLCCTFHSCPDNLPQIISIKKRLRNLSAIIIMSETQRAFFESYGVPSHKIHFIPHGIDTNFFVPTSYEKPSDDFIILSVGSYRRNFPLLRKVAVGLKKYRKIRIRVICGTAYSSYFSNLENVEVMSGLTDLELREIYQSSSCLILTVENATANNALLEGMACGLPTITERIGGIPQYVSEECAIIADERDSDQIVEAIVKLSEAPLKRKQMAQAARERALELSWPKIAMKTEELYSSLV